MTTTTKNEVTTRITMATTTTKKQQQQQQQQQQLQHQQQQKPITTNKNRTATAPTQTITSSIATNSAPSKTNKPAEDKNIKRNRLTENKDIWPAFKKLFGGRT